MVAHILFDEAVAVMAADHRVWQVHLLDFGLELAAIALGQPMAEDGGDLVRLANGAIGVEQPLAEPIEGGAAMEHEIVAEFDLGEEQPMAATGLIVLDGGEERREAGEPLLAAADEIARRQVRRRALAGDGVRRNS